MKRVGRVRCNYKLENPESYDLVDIIEDAFESCIEVPGAYNCTLHDRASCAICGAFGPSSDGALEGVRDTLYSPASKWYNPDAYAERKRKERKA